MYGLEVTAFWQPLTLNDFLVEEPENVDTLLCPPTELDVENGKAKYGFRQTFERPKFTGLDTNMIHHRNKHA
eukprot:15343475-Ditylum_brightwellii.AAC.2